MDEFLRETKQCVSLLGDGRHVHVVMGNESCDLDSVVCAVSYAFYLKKIDPSATIIPAADCSPADLHLRCDVAALFKHLNLSFESLVLASELDLEALQSAGNLKLTIVDHNELSAKWKSLKPSIIEVIDHHKDGKSHSKEVKTTIEMVGSCSSLVAEKVLSANASLVSTEVSTMLLCAILTDTINLDSEAGRTTDKDRDIADLLSQIAGHDVGQTVFDVVRKVKFDVSSLSALDLLVKDYKPVGLCSSSSDHVGISSIVCDLEEFLARGDAVEAIAKFLATKGINCLVLLSIFFPNGESKAARQIGVYCEGTALRDQVIAGLQSDDVLRLSQFSPKEHFSNIVCFEQGNRAASRKIILPLLACSLSVGAGSSILPPVDIQHNDTAALLSDASPAVLETEPNAAPVELIEEYNADEEASEERRFRAVGVEGVPSSVNLEVIGKYRRVVSHGGYMPGSKNAIIILSACYLPNKSTKDYNHVMEQLFLYVVSSVQRLAVDNYCIVLFNTSSDLNNTPGITWLKKYYSGVDRHLRKNLQNLFIYNPTLRLKVLFQLARPFISSKFWRKITYVRSLRELRSSVPLNDIDIPRSIMESDRSTSVESQSASGDVPSVPSEEDLNTA